MPYYFLLGLLEQLLLANPVGKENDEKIVYFIYIFPINFGFYTFFLLRNKPSAPKPSKHTVVGSGTAPKTVPLTVLPFLISL